MAHVESIPVRSISARRMAAWRATALSSVRASVCVMDQGRYASGPPQASAPTPITRHSPSLLQAALPINCSICVIPVDTGTAAAADGAADASVESAQDASTSAAARTSPTAAQDEPRGMGMARIQCRNADAVKPVQAPEARKPPGDGAGAASAYLRSTATGATASSTPRAAPLPSVRRRRSARPARPWCPRWCRPDPCTGSRRDSARRQPDQTS